MSGGAKPELKQRLALEARQPSASFTGQTARPARILCVDDEPAVLTILSRALGSRFEIVTMNDPEAALSLLARSGDFSVVISDLKMPAMDGADFLARARRIAPESSRLALTGCLDRELGADEVFGILTKPCPLRLLQESVTAAVQHHLLLTHPDSVLPDPLDQVLSRASAQPFAPEEMDSGIVTRRSRSGPANDSEREPYSGERLVRHPSQGGSESSGFEGLGAPEAGTLMLLAAVANKFFLLGQVAKAEQVVRAALEDLAVRARHGLFPLSKDEEIAVKLALRLAEETREPVWIDYVFRLFSDLRRPLSPTAIERLHPLLRQVPGASPLCFREYLEMLRTLQPGLGVTDQFLIRRIEGLEPLLRG